jgi:hypothetical protein
MNAVPQWGLNRIRRRVALNTQADHDKVGGLERHDPSSIERRHGS